MKPSAAMSETTVSGAGHAEREAALGHCHAAVAGGDSELPGPANLSIANTTNAAEFGFSQTEMGLLLSAFLCPMRWLTCPQAGGWTS